MHNDKLRKKVKTIKAFQDVSYKELAGYMEMNRNAFYNWLKGYYNLGNEKQRKLNDILDTISEINYDR